MSEATKTEVSKQEQTGRPSTSAKSETATASTLQPLTDIYENKDGVTLYMDLPGVNKSSLEIDVDQNVLTVKGRISLDTPEKLEPTYMDIRSGRFERRFTLGEELDSERIDANLNQGELKLFIPRSEQYKPRKIEVKAV